MDLALNETQLMLQGMAREFVEREVPKARVRQIDESVTGHSPELWAEIGSLGWAGMPVPEELGGTGNSMTDLAVVFESLGEAACPSPLLAQVLSAHVLLAVATPDQQQALLPAIAAGERLTAFVLTEADYGWDAASVRLPAASSGDGFVLNGTKRFVPYAEVADDLLVLVRTSSDADPEHGLTLVRVARTAPGIGVRRQLGWLGEPVCEVSFANVSVPGSAVIGVVGGAWPGVRSALDKSVVLLCAYMLGGSQGALDMSIEYSMDRVAFGQPIGTFQRVQDLIIKGLNDADAIRWTTYEALWKLDEGREGASLAASMAKAVASDGFQRACESCIYVHAGAGMDLDYGLTNHLKRSKFYAHYLGDAAHHKLRMASLLELDPSMAP
jgi:alkylation response protein AidB-like acyl-CoA dehydrogenase